MEGWHRRKCIPTSRAFYDVVSLTKVSYYTEMPENIVNGVQTNAVLRNNEGGVAYVHP